MPLITIELAPGRTHAQKKAFMQEVTTLTSMILKCPTETIDIIFKEIPSSDWAHAGKFYAEPDQ
ncbi:MULTISPECIES: 4-oxalocrotonate tautomerase [Acinetobacter]|jgi:4-oxalocrotonate tautomerase|uniref:4-oxalocrotonate tautomerase n=1 Tax=Acinetobacter bereziniae TaxID=106648 RepID=A0A0A8TTU4_ACIBZ|nr:MULTISPECIES: 4-oxalocrotonate tautomerase [Acinetobacter]MEC8122231.1 4-oxalocrotonate tautomerase [Pseudomonadota bacterium]ELW82840.1 4-oxalocrotonate tautomerase family enzyme [Acinetobacter sp. WC-743]KKW75807.1 4-oxalocrotonate tautomerase [Acinetobacter sp. Ag2]MBI0393428.1 4-oxalocrotonate tautomerase [Acinetobacter bereziniae]MBJ8422115.1 4-oxalocrotonate tautomerase [Acinetobacter bereziniae]